MAGLLQDIELFGQDIPLLEDIRKKGRNAFVLPTVKNEAWRYTKLHALKADDFEILPRDLEIKDSTKEGCQCRINCALDLPFETHQLHFYNGKFVPVHPVLPSGIKVMTLLEALVTGAFLEKSVDFAEHPFAALNAAYLEEGLFICVKKNTILEKPLMIVNHTDCGGQNILCNTRNVIMLEEGAKVELLEYYRYSGEPKSRYFNNIVNEIYLNPAAELNHYKFQNEAFKAVHIALNLVHVKGGGFYKSFCLQKGADLGRNETKVLLEEENAKAEIDAAYVMNGWATLDIETNVEHLSPRTHSSQLVKGVVGGEARGVFQGKIHIAKHAVETTGYQLHKAMLLSDTAEIDVKPELRIYADNVKCSHGAACGELDKEQLFYMRSRGISKEEAEKILIDAYLQEAINRIDNPFIKEWMAAHV